MPGRGAVVRKCHRENCHFGIRIILKAIEKQKFFAFPYLPKSRVYIFLWERCPCVPGKELVITRLGVTRR